jgi:hypothetical protein
MSPSIAHFHNLTVSYIVLVTDNASVSIFAPVACDILVPVIAPDPDNARLAPPVVLTVECTGC